MANKTPQAGGVLVDWTQNEQDLGAVIMSEASVGNDAERTAVGSTVVNRMTRNNATTVRAVWGGYAHSQAPTTAILTLARGLLNGSIPDNSAGATHFYSPRSMPKEGDDTTGYDVGGGLELVPPLTVRNYRPSWVLTYIAKDVTGARPDYFKFYAKPGNGPVT